MILQAGRQQAARAGKAHPKSWLPLTNESRVLQKASCQLQLSPQQRSAWLWLAPGAAERLCRHTRVCAPGVPCLLRLMHLHGTLLSPLPQLRQRTLQPCIPVLVEHCEHMLARQPLQKCCSRGSRELAEPLMVILPAQGQVEKDTQPQKASAAGTRRADHARGLSAKDALACNIHSQPDSQWSAARCWEQRRRIRTAVVLELWVHGQPVVMPWLITGRCLVHQPLQPRVGAACVVAPETPCTRPASKCRPAAWQPHPTAAHLPGRSLL